MENGNSMQKERNFTVWIASDRIAFTVWITFLTEKSETFLLYSVSIPVKIKSVICKLINLQCNVYFMNKFKNETEISEYV